MKFAICLTNLVAMLVVATASPLQIRFGNPAPSESRGSSGPSNPMATSGTEGARNWESEALPLGNGRLGAMLFGGVDRERMQFNVDSLWTGGANESGEYDVNEFGCYQSFGNVLIESAETAVEAQCSSGHEPYTASEGISAAADDNPRTKWCVEHRGRPVIWQVKLPQPTLIDGYSLISADDVAERDPRQWRFEGSVDGQQWDLLDEKNQAPFAARGKQQDFSVNLPKPYAHYRFVFAPAADATHFQVAEIRLGREQTPQQYQRVLDLTTALHAVSWMKHGVSFSRETFASAVDQALVTRLTASKPASLSGVLRCEGTHGENTVARDGSLHFGGALANGLRYAAQLSVQHRGGKVIAEGSTLRYQGCDELLLVLTAATDYRMDETKNWRGEAPEPIIAVQSKAVLAQSWDHLRQAHVSEYQRYFSRVSLQLGEAADGDTPTRLKAYRNGAEDAALEALMFQYGRYLLISSSRPGCLPANLQGIWNDKNKPAWYSDYHTNINIQMNYWQAETANLADCHMPLFDWVEACVPAARRATQKSFGEKTPGWTMRTSVNPFGGNGWQWNLPASAWLAQHFWEHYAFGLDRDFLRQRAWPVLADVSRFWLSHLIADAKGRLVAPKGWSPEHGPREDGVAHDQQIIWDLFTNTLQAAEVLGEKSAFIDELRSARDRLAGPQIGRWGQLMEWQVDRDDPEDGHRHTSHLFAVYPGSQISREKTPDFAKAAAVSLKARGTSGDSRRSWTWPWRTALWARLGEPEMAHEMVRGLLTHNTLSNLWTTHPPFQIDGNLGITAGMAEMLLQSHAGEIAVLPALTAKWSTGSFTGLRARGGVTVDASWRDAKLTSLSLQTLNDTVVTVRLPDGSKQSVTCKGGVSQRVK